MVWKIVKWVLIVLVVLWILFTILANLGGNTPVLKDAIEEFLSEQTGYPAKVGQLNEMTFFPDMGINVQGVYLDTPEEATPPITIERAEISLRFFDVMFGRRALRTIDVSNIQIPKGVLGGYEASIEHIKIIDQPAPQKSAEEAPEAEETQIEQTPANEEPQAAGAYLELKGIAKGKPVMVKVDLTPKGSAYGRYYKVEDDTNIEALLGALQITTKLEKSLLGGSTLKEMSLLHNGRKALSGDVYFKRDGDNGWEVKGDVAVNKGVSILKPDLKIEKTETLIITGSIESEVLDINDLKSPSPFLDAIDEIDSFLGSEKSNGFDFSGESMDVALDIKQLNLGKMRLGNVKSPLTMGQNVLKIAPLDGSISGGALSGEIALDANPKPAHLSIKAKVKNFDYGALQKQFEPEAQINGKADLLVNLNSYGSSPDALGRGLSGKTSFIGGEAKMRTGLLNIWGGGLLNALLPNLGSEDDLNVNCVVADFELEKSLAKAQSLFVDTRRITLSGKGTYNLDKNYLDIELSPKAKDVAIGDISSAVIVSGPLDELSVNPSVFGLGKKIGGLLLGAVNPAFLALTLADLGLGDNHPCKQFVIQKETLAPPPVEEPKAEEPKAEDVEAEQEPASTEDAE